MGKDARSSRSSRTLRTPLAVTANKEGAEHAELAESGAAMQVEMLEYTITKIPYQLFFLFFRIVILLPYLRCDHPYHRRHRYSEPASLPHCGE